MDVRELRQARAGAGSGVWGAVPDLSSRIVGEGRQEVERGLHDVHIIGPLRKDAAAGLHHIGLHQGLNAAGVTGDGHE